MDDILKAESDWETMNIVYNTVTKSDVASAKFEKMKKFNSLGHLYPAKSSQLENARAWDGVQGVLKNTDYEKYFEEVPNPFEDDKNDKRDPSRLEIDDYQKKDLAYRYSKAFFGQY